MKRGRMILFLFPLALTMLACLFGSIPPTPTPNPTATPTPFTPTPQPSLTPTEDTSAGGSAGNNTGGSSNGGGVVAGCTPRTDWPLYTVQSGDTLSTIAQRANTSADVLQSANCFSSANLIYAGSQIRVPIVPSGASPVTVPTAIPGCQTAWFFSFNANIPESIKCPDAVINTPAAGEDFEGGRAYYYAAFGSAVGPLVYVIYNDGTWEQYDDTFNGRVEPASDPNIAPPAGRYQPVRAIGKVWRNNPNVRAKLGWAFAREGDFLGRRQSTTASNALFIDHGIRRTVLRLEPASHTWVVAGTY